MNCPEVRNLVLAYLDSELDARTTQDIGLHLQSCSECASIFEAEASFNSRVFSRLRAGEATPTLWTQLEERLQPTRRWEWLRPRRRSLVRGSVAVLAAAVVLVGWVVSRSRSASLDFATAMEPDHAKYVAGQLHSQFDAGPSPEALAREQGRLDAAAFSKLPVAAGFRAEGKRVCHLAGVPVAWVLGRDQGLPVSVVVLRRSELGHFPQLRRRLATGHQVVCAQTRRYQFAARVVGEHVVCSIGSLPRARLEDLVLTVPNTSDEG
jgi:anti-sigma factor RsiW